MTRRPRKGLPKLAPDRSVLTRLLSLVRRSRLGADLWVPAPLPAVDPGAAGVPTESLSMPSVLDRFAAPPVFICGSARSGTTWLFDLFARHPLVHAICESWVLSQTHGVTSILAQPYWDVAVRRSWEERVDVPFGAVQLASYDRVVQDLSGMVARWLADGAAEHHQYLVAKEPLDVRAAAILFPQARFIHVIRDGRDVALSMRHASETWDPSMGIDLPMSVRAAAWRRQVESIREHSALLDGRYLEMRYEHVRADPAAALSAMFEFAGIPHEPRLLQEIGLATSLPNYPERARRSGFRGGSLDAGARRWLSPLEALEFHRGAGGLLIELGYEPDRRWLVRSLLAPGR